MRKKILEYPIFKVTEIMVQFWKQENVVEDTNHPANFGERLISRFGAINEDEFNEICMALTFISKFIDFLIMKKSTICGRSYTVQSITREKPLFSLKLSYSDS